MEPEPKIAGSRAGKWIGAAMLIPCFSFIFWAVGSFREPWDGDSMYFMPQIVSLAHGDGLVNPQHPPGIGDGSPEAKFTWHGFFYESAVGRLLPPDGYRSLGIAVALLCCLTCWLVLLAVRDELGRACAGHPLMFVLSLGGILVSSVTYVTGTVGRPETMVALLVAGFCAAASRRSGKFLVPAAGVAIGLIGATSPLAGVIAAEILCIFLLGSRRPGEALGGIVRAGLVAAAVFAASFTVYPYSVRDWIGGMLVHSGQMMHFVGSGYFYYWFLCPAHPFLAPLLLLALVCGIRPLIRRNDSSRIGLAAALLVFAVTVARFASDERVYNLVGFFPLAAWVGVHWLGSLRESSQSPGSRRLLRIWHASTWLACSSGCLVWLLIGVLGRVHVTRGDLEEEMRGFCSQGTVAVSGGLFTAIPPGKKVEILEPAKYLDSDWIQSTRDRVLIQQINPYKDSPKQYKNYRLLKNGYHEEPVFFLGMRLARSPRDYSYAAYVRNDQVR